MPAGFAENEAVRRVQQRIGGEVPLRIETAARVLKLLLVVGLLATPLLAFATSHLVTLGHDEAWVLSDIRNLLEHGQYGGDAQPPAFTSGGAFTVGVAILSFLSDGSVPVIRLLSVASLALILYLAASWGRDLFGDGTTGHIVAASILAVPGTLMFASTAYAATTATALVLAGAILWTRLEPRSWTRITIVGCAFGLAAATRWNCVVVLPALLFAAAAEGKGRRRAELWDAALASVVGSAVLAASVGLLVALSDESASLYSKNLQEVGKTFVTEVELLNRSGILMSFLPLPLLVGATAIWVWSGRRHWSHVRGLHVVPCFAWFLWLAWLVRPSQPHLRYLWPALASFALMMGFGVARLYVQASEDRGLRLTALLVALSSLLVFFGSSLRAIRLGDNDITSWEWARQMRPISDYTPFERRRDQERMADYINRTVPADETVMVFGLAIALDYLSRRTLRTSEWLEERGLAKHAESLPRKLLVTPAIKHYFGKPRSVQRWVSRNCRLIARYGEYRLYEVVHPDVEHLPIRRSR